MRTNPRTAAERNAVIAVKGLLEQAGIDEIVPHILLKETIHHYIPESTTQNPYYYIVRKAKDILNEEVGAIFGTINREGYRRLSSSNGVEYAGKRPLERIRRTARRSSKQLINASRHSNNLSPSEQRRASQRLATLGLIEHLTLAKTVSTMVDELHIPTDPLKPLRDSLGL